MLNIYRYYILSPISCCFELNYFCPYMVILSCLVLIFVTKFKMESMKTSKLINLYMNKLARTVQSIMVIWYFYILSEDWMQNEVSLSQSLVHCLSRYSQCFFQFLPSMLCWRIQEIPILHIWAVAILVVWIFLLKKF